MKQKSIFLVFFIKMNHLPTNILIHYVVFGFQHYLAIPFHANIKNIVMAVRLYVCIVSFDKTQYFQHPLVSTVCILFCEVNLISTIIINTNRICLANSFLALRPHTWSQVSLEQRVTLHGKTIRKILFKNHYLFKKIFTYIISWQIKQADWLTGKIGVGPLG